MQRPVRRLAQKYGALTAEQQAAPESAPKLLELNNVADCAITNYVKVMSLAGTDQKLAELKRRSSRRSSSSTRSSSGRAGRLAGDAQVGRRRADTDLNHRHEPEPDHDDDHEPDDEPDDEPDHDHSPPPRPNTSTSTSPK